MQLDLHEGAPAANPSAKLGKIQKVNRGEFGENGTSALVDEVIIPSPWQDACADCNFRLAYMRSPVMAHTMGVRIPQS